jgi:signal transduction histidine kinase
VIGRISLVLSLRDLTAAEQKTRKTALITALLSSILSTLILYLVLRRILGRPIEQLVGATKRISEGDLGYQVPIETRDEIGDLAASFNKMTQSLRDAQEELVRKEKLSILGQLSGSVGHELRNPLGIISNAIYFLKTVMPDAEEVVKEYLDIVKNEVNNCERIISDLLDFARTKTPQTSSITARELIHLSIGKCVIPENVSLTVDTPEGLPLVTVDPLQIVQVFQNIITNAVQAMPEGGSLRVSARLSAECGVRNAELKEADHSELRTLNSALHGNFIEVSVTDTGEGITPENMKKLFQPLFTTKAKGIGLGLVVLKKLTEVNGGTVRVESEAGKGTTFTIALATAGANVQHA